MITLSEFKAYVNITGSDKDSLLQGFISSAIEKLNSECNRKFIRDTFTEYFNYPNCKTVYLQNAPVVSITSLQYYSDNAYTNLIDGSGHTIDNSIEINSNSIVAVNSYSFSRNKLKVVYVGGYKFTVGTGRVKVLAGSKNVEGLLGTLFTDEIVAGDYIYFDGLKRKVATIVDATHLTLTEAVLEDHISVTFTVSNVPDDLCLFCCKIAAEMWYESPAGKGLLLVESKSTEKDGSFNYKALDWTPMLEKYRVINI